MKKCLLACGLLLCLFVTFFNPFSLKFYFTLPSLINYTMIAAMSYLFYRSYADISSVKLSKTEKLAGILLGACMTLGYGLTQGDGFDIFYGRAIAVLFTLISLTIYISFSLLLLKYFFFKTEKWMDAEKKPEKKPSNRFLSYIFRHIEENRFSFYFLFFLLAWIIPFMINFPGFTMFDTRNQVDMYYHIPNLHTNATVLLDESQYITQHHSVPHTLFLGLVFDLGMALFKTYEAGIFIYCLIQYICVAAAVAYMFKSIKKHFSTKQLFAGLVLFGVHPFFPISAFLMTKDVLFCGLFIVYLVQYYKLLKDPDRIKKPSFFIGFLAVSIGLLLLRNNALFYDSDISGSLDFYKKQEIYCIIHLFFYCF